MSNNFLSAYHNPDQIASGIAVAFVFKLNGILLANTYDVIRNRIHYIQFFLSARIFLPFGLFKFILLKIKIYI